MRQYYEHQTVQKVDRPTGRHTNRYSMLFMTILCTADSPIGGQADRSTHGQVQHVVNEAILCTADSPIGGQVDTPKGRHIDRLTGQHKDRYGMLYMWQHYAQQTGQQVYRYTGLHTDRSTHLQVDTPTGTANRLCGKFIHSRQADTPTSRYADRSTHRQVLHDVYVATLCTSDKPIGRQAVMSTSREVYTSTGRHTDRYCMLFMWQHYAHQTGK